ncbi:ribosomal protein large subunit L1 [Thermoplasma volcanium GSS1]|uniref:Large ribosomal subunit protein uL1 n=1 Tax=Thermoplasma volcanium (strain ATCC 51530 / DSM 4299 / JCM 9571 / NBRC 15438 / GSS1) TaxID=273116 RepID=RL1_THEVO|nr:50S ribosomal protein L1 [Thermoplasma volcanium]Q97BN2.1 RecName: Full=Large ribosomal subunit protein uL1; AltName: Full=50S ribosomal protein L1 [Thermoplasma volcanium GSS1]BAB59565.1 ribosomal protein large subunit L1 [Thermoplasma volcanium GSS1]
MDINDISKAVEAVKQSSPQRKFEESVEIAINLKDIDMTNPKNRINEEILLPNGRGKDVKVVIFGSEELKAKAKGVADYIFGPEDISKFAEDKKAFKKIVNDAYFFIAEATLMANIGKSLGQVLGPRGKMPRPIPPGQDPVPLIKALKNTVKARSRNSLTLHVPVGTRSMDTQKISENIMAILNRITGKLERGHSNIKNVYVKTTMGKAVQVGTGDQN